MQKTITALMALVAASWSGIGTALAAEGNLADLVNRRVLRVCSDPANMPFSNLKEEGFENKIAEIIGDELGLPVDYRFLPQSRGFVRNTLVAKRCDLIVGTVQGEELVLNTNHYYRSTYALVFKPGTGMDGVKSLSDPKMKGKSVGIQIGAPSGDLVARAGLMDKARPYRLFVDRRYESPAEEMMEGIRKGEIDAAVLWGPLAGYYAKRGGEELTVVPLIKDQTARTTFRITMGVRQSDAIWKRKLNDVIAKRQGDIDQVLLDYNVPILDEQDNQITKARMDYVPPTQNADNVPQPNPDKSKQSSATAARPAPPPATP